MRDIIVTVIGDGGATVSLSLDATKVGKVVAGRVHKVTLGATESSPPEVAWPQAAPRSRPSRATTPTPPRSRSDALTDRILPQGARADVAIIVGSSEDTLSAIITQTNGATVRVLGENGLRTKNRRDQRPPPRSATASTVATRRPRRHRRQSIR